VLDRDLLMAAMALIACGIAAARMPGSLTAFAAAWVLLFLLPTLMVAGLPAYEHRLYLPMIGVALVIAIAAHGKTPNMALVAVVVAILGVGTWMRLGVFRNPMTYWSDAARDPVFGPLAHVNLGQLHEADGRLGQARREYLRALERDRDTPKAHNNLGVVLMKLEEPDLAYTHFQEETKRHPWNADAWFNLGLFEELRGNEAAARSHYERAIVANPAYRPAYEKLGRAPLDK
jgi:tetratricopeptide (TPR) repeat protein